MGLEKQHENKAKKGTNPTPKQHAPISLTELARLDKMAAH